MSDLWLSLTRLAILMLTAWLAWVTYRSNLLLKTFRPDFNLLLAPPEFVIRVLLVGLCLLLAWLTGLSPAQLGLSVAKPLRSIGLGVAAGIAIVAAINLVTVWAIGHFGRHIYSPWLIRNILPRRFSEWLLVPVALLPAVAMEELLFRTLWLGGFGTIIPLPFLIVGTSVLFGLMHLPQGQLGMVTAGSVNVILSLLFLWSGGLLVPFAAHYTINLLQVVVGHYQHSWLESY